MKPEEENNGGNTDIVEEIYNYQARIGDIYDSIGTPIAGNTPAYGGFGG
jgi:hypothetical protein